VHVRNIIQNGQLHSSAVEVFMIAGRPYELIENLHKLALHNLQSAKFDNTYCIKDICFCHGLSWQWKWWSLNHSKVLFLLLSNVQQFKTWKENCFSCLAAEEIYLVQICDLNVIIQVYLPTFFFFLISYFYLLV
jgi:hypothetical protein